MTTELWILLAAVALGLVHVFAPAQAFTAKVGLKYNASPRDEELKPTGVAARLYRAQSNFMETFPFFAAMVLAVEVTGANGALSVIGAWLYLVGRIVYLPLYAAGVPYLRSVAFLAATAGIVLIGAELVF